VLSVEGEGLGVNSTPETLHWAGEISGASTLGIGAAEGAATAVKLHVVCRGGTYNKSLSGKLEPTIENGTSIGSSPTKITFAAGGLKNGVEPEIKFGGKMKVMGFEGGELIQFKHP
jgi:hypothetical protein